MRKFKKLVLFLLFLLTSDFAAALTPDEGLFFAPTYGARTSSGTWAVDVHGWVYEKETDSLWRKALVRVLGKGMGYSRKESQAFFNERMASFFRDNERGKSFDILLGKRELTLKPSEPSGHIHDSLNLPGNLFPGWHDFKAFESDPSTPVASGNFRLIPENGTSVISDIDDTVKFTDVTDGKTMMRRTFVEEFEPVPGMADLYEEWEKEGAAFHYVSASPWPLAPYLQQFLAINMFPKGSLHFRHFRWKDGSFLDMKNPSGPYKIDAISAILTAFPKRKFILVGDSAEQDPEVYGEVARLHAGQVSHVYIRQATPDRLKRSRFSEAFKGSGDNIWTVFKDPDEIRARGALPGTLPLQLEGSDRILVLAPHPDDEALGCSGILQKAAEMKLPVQVAFLTHGDANQEAFWLYERRPVISSGSVIKMGEVRGKEAQEAGEILGIKENQIIFLGYPDLGSFLIWRKHWLKEPPFHGTFTRADSVPYPSAFRPGAPYKGEEIVKDLTRIIKAFEPTKIFVSHPADFHPDHSVLYLFTRVALLDLEEDDIQPDVFPYLIHMSDWPNPPGIDPGDYLRPPLSNPRDAVWHTVELSTKAVEAKRAALQAHKTQYLYSSKQLLPFVRRNEIFSDAPVLSLAEPYVSDHGWPEISIKEAGKEWSGISNAKGAGPGVARREIRLEGQDLVVSFRFAPWEARAMDVNLYLYGYQKGEPFEEMPKIEVRTEGKAALVSDQGEILPKESVNIDRQKESLTLTIPLKLLGEPTHLFFGSRSRIKNLPLDWVIWKSFEIPNSP